MTRRTSDDALGDGIYWLGDPASRDPAVVGEAVACLGRLTSLRHTPPAFCLAAPPFGVLPDGSLAAGAAAIAGMYARLAGATGQPDPPVVVRSALVGTSRSAQSWVAEPWTFWNVAGLEALCAAITECAVPYVSDRAAAYRAAHSGEGADVVLAMLVQQFIAAEVCSHVLVGAGEEAVMIRSRLGLCEFAAATGWDTTIVRRGDYAVVKRTIADKRQMTVAAAGGVVEVDVPAANRLTASLGDDQARRLAEFAATIQPQVSGLVDAEVAWRGGEMHLLWCEPVRASAPG